MATVRAQTVDSAFGPLRVPPTICYHHLDSKVGFKIAIDPDAAMGQHGQPLDPISRAFTDSSTTPNLALIRLMFRFVKPGDMVLDLGAHVGTVALPIAASGCRVIAIEASPRNVAVLRESVAQNGWSDGVTVIHAAVSDKSGELTFSPWGPWGHVATNKMVRASLAVPAARLDDLLARAGCDRVDFIKMDIEGSEVHALHGANRLLRKCNAPILYESNYIGLDFYNRTPRDLRAAFVKFDYLYHYIVRHHRLIAVAPDDFQGDVVGEYLACKTTVTALKDWAIESHLSQAEQIDAIVSNQQQEDPQFRVQIGRALREAPANLLATERIQAFLRSLQADPSEQVRDAIAWLTRPQKGFFGRLFDKLGRG